MNTRKEKSTERYRQKLHDLGIDTHFEYLEFVSKGHHRIRCKKCGMILKRSDDLFKGKTKTFKCRYCGNGMKAFSDFANEVLEFYQNGHSQRETMDKFGISRNDLQNWVKRRGVTNGRTFKQGAAESNKKRHDEALHIRKEKRHFRRATKKGLPAQRDITLAELIRKKGDTCSICGLPCYYYGDYRSALYPSIDHIIPINKGGGHTWDNVQVAHRICNSHKKDYIGKEWNNGAC